MTPEAIQLVSLIGLRALADYDLAEFSRVTDMSKRQLDERIDMGLRSLRNLNDDRGREEAESRLGELREIERESQSHTELNFLLRQLSQSCLQRAQQLALAYSRTAAPRQRPPNPIVDSAAAPTPESRLRPEEEYLRLAVMRLIRDLPEYVPAFNYRIKNREIDCFLTSGDIGTPAIIVEGKRSINSPLHLEETAKQLKHAASGWGRSAILVIITTGVVRGALRPVPGVHVLIYDAERDDFVGESAQPLIAVARQAIGRS